MNMANINTHINLTETPSIIDKHAEVLMENIDLILEDDNNIIDIIKLIFNDDLTMYKNGKITRSEYIDKIKKYYVSNVNDEKSTENVLNLIKNNVENNEITIDDLTEDIIICDDYMKSIRTMFNKYALMYEQNSITHEAYINLMKNNYNDVICYALKKNHNQVINMVLQEFKKNATMQEYFQILHHDKGAILKYAREHKNQNNINLILDEYKLLHDNGVIPIDEYDKIINPSELTSIMNNFKRKFSELF